MIFVQVFTSSQRRMNFRRNPSFSVNAEYRPMCCSEMDPPCWSQCACVEWEDNILNHCETGWCAEVHTQRRAKTDFDKNRSIYINNDDNKDLRACTRYISITDDTDAISCNSATINNIWHIWQILWDVWYIIMIYDLQHIIWALIHIQ